MDGMKVAEQITFLYCSDLSRTGSFYEDLLGFPLVIDQGSCRVVQVAEGRGGYLGYCERLEEGESASSGIIFTLTVDKKEQVDDWYNYLVEHGLELPEPPKDNPRYGIYHFFFEDPDGYKLEVQSFHDQEWKKPV
jgi:catechol 2,3-dioxygenase-like lactoylglutathione lyase family enzyme